MIIAYYPLHYGSDYMAYSLKSVYEFVDKIYILYTDRPSYGHGTTLRNPDSREKLRAATYANGDPRNKIIWHDGNWHNEGEHRNTIASLAPDADFIVAVDSDEIWRPETLTMALDVARTSSVRNHLIRMDNLWRSFSWHCQDEMWPCRVIAAKRPDGLIYLSDRVLHFGYARSVPEIAYKLSCHGHKNEWRGDWFKKFGNWPASGNNDLHPTCVDVWNAVPFNKMELPPHMHAHPYFALDVIP